MKETFFFSEKWFPFSQSVNLSGWIPLGKKRSFRMNSRCSKKIADTMGESQIINLKKNRRLARRVGAGSWLVGGGGGGLIAKGDYNLIHDGLL